jgi:hypothetical protein
LERIKTTMAEVARHNLEQDYLRERERTLLANKALWDEVKERRRREEEAELEEEEPEETHWDKGTQTEDMIPEQDLPPKKRHIQMKNHHEDKTRMSRLELCPSNNKCTPRSVPQPCY